MAENVDIREDVVLGLDLGTTSVGWALLLNLSDKGQTTLLRTGVRHFDPGSQNLGKGKVGPTAEASNATARRQHRSQRRQLRRRAGRMARLYKTLADAGLLPRLRLPRIDRAEEETSSMHRRRVENAEREARDLALRKLDLELWSRIKAEKLGDHGDTLPYLPFVLRTHGLDRELTPLELGRALYHLAQHRGFSIDRSGSEQERLEIANAESDLAPTPPDGSPKKKKEAGGKFASALQGYRTRLNTLDSRGKTQRTIGEIQYRMIQNKDVTQNGDRMVTIRRLGEPAWRHMYEDEFNAIWDKQAEYRNGYLQHDVTVKFRRSKRGGGDPEQVLTRNEALRDVVADTIFHQRPLKSTTHLIGDCDFENGINWLRQEGRQTTVAPRLPWAHPLAQRYRMLAMVNNAGLINPDNSIEPLTPDQRRDLIALLSRATERVKFPDAKARIGVVRRKFNFERKESSAEKSFEVLKSEHMFRAAFGPRWDSFSDADREAVFHDWYSIKKEPALKFRFAIRWELGIENASKSPLTGEALTRAIASRRCEAKQASRQYGFREATADFGELNYSAEVMNLARATLESGYCNLSARAIRRLLPLMDNDTTPLTSGEARERLYERRATEPVDRLKPLNDVFPELTSPVVRRALTETRRVVNALIQEEGYKPGRIHVEVARALRVGKDGRKEIIDRQKLDRAANESAAKIAREMGILDERGNPLVTKVKLAQECGWCCPYTGKSFGAAEIRNRDVEIEHIIPESMMPGDDAGNLTLAYRVANATKGDNPPHAAFGHSPAGYSWVDILNRVARFKTKEQYAKLRDRRAEDCNKQGKAPKPENSKHRLFLLEGTRANPSDALRKHCEGFTHADLRQTAWMTKAACGYLATLYGIPASAPHQKDSGDNGKRRIYAVAGGVTGFLRRNLGRYLAAAEGNEPQDKHWQDLNSILQSTQKIAIPDEAHKHKKSRADLRHHAIDAIVVALADQQIVNRINQASASSSTARKQRARKTVREAARASWPSIYDDITAAMYGGIDAQGVEWSELVVSERTSRRLQGELHNATLLRKGKGRITVGDSVRARQVQTMNNPLMLVFKKGKCWGGMAVSLLKALELRSRGKPLSSLLEADQEFQFILWKKDSIKLVNNQVSVRDQPARWVYYVNSFEAPAGIKASPHWWGANADRDNPASIRAAISTVIQEYELRRVCITATGRVSYLEPVHD